MAVSSRWQGSGAGSALVRHGLDVLEASGATLVWANGRDPALAFYRRHGFVVLGDGFLGAEGVPHHWIARRLGRLR
jgi:predicted N-acetyltransferase YhbS